jgi:uncharacterized protein involved in exopolysaccharide biosynthesis
MIVLLVLGFAEFALGQTSTSSTVGPIRSSAAYAEILLRKTELLADIEAYGADYTEASAKMIELRTELASLDRSLEKVFAVKPSETNKLTQALGKLIVKKAALDADLNRLSRQYNKDHPEVKRAQKRTDRFEASINEILK